MASTSVNPQPSFGSEIGTTDSKNKNGLSNLSERSFGEPEMGYIVKSEDRLSRSLSARQVQMIAIAGVIGTGLFLGTGKSLAEAGPASLLIAYFIIGIVVYLTMNALGEMATYVPVAGSFCTYATRYVDEAFGFALLWNYWFNDAVSTASDLTALQLVFAYWTDFPSWIIALIFWVFLICANLIHVKVYGELEYWLALLKVVTIVIFMIISIVVNAGANTQHEYLGFHYWYIGDAPFVNNFKGFASVFVTASFAYGGTESIAITAGETKNPSRVMPRVVKTVFWRILFFYVLTVLFIGINVPYNYPNLSTGGTALSPFTITFQLVGSKAAGSFMNAVIVTSVISAGNHALFAGTRLLYTLGVEGFAPKIFTVLTPHKVPYVALLATASISGLCFGASFIGTGTLWAWLQNLVGVSNQLAWLSIGVTAIRFRQALNKQGKTHLLKFKNWTYPWGPWIVVVGVTVIILVQGWSAFAPWSVSSFFSYYIELFIMPVMYIFWKIVKRTKFVKLEDMDLDTDRYVETEEDLAEMEYEDSLTGWRRVVNYLKGFVV
ncbi:lysine permease [Sugiyamaella lignohabitans]|uniref:Lysine permease n=1 Tax=Sugiyamaella lignohabitans TaxID=796027 RepID=A0A167EF07_9ASCO|nr:lysine permease [Sugiyamaella lignohabitans]ANB13993.1 lysine permease [Sugiyamaella lignohabitans]